MGDTLAFVQVEPADPQQGEEPFGYAVLKKLIRDFLGNAIEERETEVM